MDRGTVSSGVGVVFYCATCKVEYAEDADGRIGLRFICPNDAPDRPAHLASVVKGPSGKRWLSMQLWLARYDERYSPRNWFKTWGGRLVGRVGFYVVLRFLFLLLALARTSLGPARGGARIGRDILAWAIAACAIVDILLAHTYIAFVRRSTADPLRTTVLALFSFAQLALAYAVLYALIGSQFQPPLHAVRAVYFSFITISTLSYGDIRPLDEAWLAQSMVVAELVFGLYFLAVVVAIVTSWANVPPAAQKIKPLAYLLPPPESH